MRFSDAPPMSKDEYDRLPPLVKKGEDRETVLSRIVDGWCTPTGQRHVDTHIAAGGFVLDGVAFVDENTGEAVDLGELLRRVEAKLRAAGEPEEYRERPDLFILLRCCRVDVCNASKLIVPPSFVSFRGRFGAGASFNSATFGAGAIFASATFDDETSFNSATFGDGASFASATFGSQVTFRSATFCAGAIFQSATFGDWASFDLTRFADVASFDSATFGNWARFSSATFGDEAGFDSAMFGDGAKFSSATFADLASFESATFGAGARFDSATFGNRAAFDSATFGDEASFESATFGDRASFDSATFGGSPRFLNARFGSYGGIGRARVGRPRHRWRILSPGSPGREWFNWSRAATLGRLHVLTRVSYLALLFVPLVAGAWPAVRAAVHGVAQDARRAAEAVQRAAEAAEGTISTTQPAVQVIKDLQTVTSEVQHTAQRLSGLLAEFEQRPHDLPLGWVVAFFAALSVAAGHFLFQVLAHEVVREKSSAAFRRERNAEFREALGPQRDDLLMRAFKPLERISEKLPGSRNRTLVSHNGRTVWIPDTLDHLRRVDKLSEAAGAPPVHATPEGETTPPEGKTDAGAAAARGSDRRVAATQEELELIVIDEGARAEYDLLARERMWGAYLSGILYLAGVGFILWLVYLQANVVLRAAGVNAGHAAALVAKFAMWAGLAAVALLIGVVVVRRVRARRASGVPH